MAKPYLLETIYDSDPKSNMHAKIYGRLHSGVVYFDAEIVRTYVFNGKEQTSHRIPIHLEPRRRSLSRQAAKWVENNRAEIQSTVSRKLAALRK
jgi:hypothetical protein